MELVHLYNQARVFLFAAYHEPFGLVLLEAASCGTYIIGVDDGAVGELVHTSFGSITKRNEKEYAVKIADACAQELSWGRRQEIHTHIAKKWNWERSVQRLETILQSVV